MAMVSIATLFVFAVFLIPLALTPSFRSSITAAPDTVGLPYEAIDFSSGAPGNLGLPGWWIPADDPVGTVVVVHDGASNRSLIWEGGLTLLKRLQEARYSILVFDLPGHGDAPDAGNTPTGANVAGAVVAAVDYARARNPNLPVSVHGFGLGGVAAIYAVASESNVSALSVDSVWADLHNSLLQTVPDVTLIPAFVLAPSLLVSETVYGVDYAGSRPIDVIDDIDVPVLVIRNAADRQVLGSHSAELAAAAPRGDLWTTPAPPEAHPVYRERGSWGTHTQSFNLDPDGYITRLIGFYQMAGEVR